MFTGIVQAADSLQDPADQGAVIGSFPLRPFFFRPAKEFIRHKISQILQQDTAAGRKQDLFRIGLKETGITGYELATDSGAAPLKKR